MNTAQHCSTLKREKKETYLLQPGDDEEWTSISSNSPQRFETW